MTCKIKSIFHPYRYVTFAAFTFIMFRSSVLNAIELSLFTPGSRYGCVDNNFVRNLLIAHVKLQCKKVDGVQNVKMPFYCYNMLDHRSEELSINDLFGYVKAFFVPFQNQVYLKNLNCYYWTLPVEKNLTTSTKTCLESAGLTDNYFLFKTIYKRNIKQFERLIMSNRVCKYFREYKTRLTNEFDRLQSLDREKDFALN